MTSQNSPQDPSFAPGGTDSSSNAPTPDAQAAPASAETPTAATADAPTHLGAAVASSPAKDRQTQEPQVAAGPAIPEMPSPTPAQQTAQATLHSETTGETGQPSPAVDSAGQADTASPGASEAKTGFFSTHPVLRVPQSMPPSVFSRLFNGLAYAPWLVLTLMLAAQTIFSLNARELWYSDEIRHADAFRNLIEGGHWLVLQMNGQPYPDKPPLYFWFLRGLYYLVKTDGPMLYFSAAAVSALLYLWSFLALGRLVGRADGRSLLASGIVLLCGGYMLGVTHYARMDLLFSALIVAGQTALFLALVRPRATGSMIFAFMLFALACLTKGPLALAFPLASMVLFVLWRGIPGRLFSRDLLVGLITALIILAAWAGAVYHQTGSFDFLINSVLKKQIMQRALDTFHHKESWHYYLIRLPLMLLPFALVVFCLPWTGLFGKDMRAGLAASRRPEAEGLAYLWCMALSGVVLLSALSGKIVIYYLPALPALALLTGRAILELSGRRAGLFRLLFVIFLLLAGAAVVLASFLLFGTIPMPDIKGLPHWTLPMTPALFIIGMGVIAAGLFFWLGLRGSQPEGVLLVFALAATALAYPLNNMAAPAFDRVMSPKAQAEVMREYVKEGYIPVSYKDYGGTYSYYTRSVIREMDNLEQIAALVPANKVVLAMKRSALTEWKEKPACFTEVHSQYIETSERVLLVCPAKGQPPAAPSPQESKPTAPVQPTAPEASKPSAPAPGENVPQPPKAATPGEGAAQPSVSTPAPAASESAAPPVVAPESGAPATPGGVQTPKDETPPVEGPPLAPRVPSSTAPSVPSGERNFSHEKNNAGEQ